MDQDYVGLFVPIVFCITLFSFLAVAAWLKARVKERESYYRSETVKKMAEASGAGISAALDFFREQENKITQQRRESRKLTGLISVAVGIALIVFLRADSPHDPDYLAGLFPLLIGAAYLTYVYVLAPKEQ
jgi:hypothetical protein